MIHGANLSVTFASRNTLGPARSTPAPVLSAPEPDISLHLLIQVLKILNQAPNSLIQSLAAGPLRSAVIRHFSSKIIALAPSMNPRAKSQQGFANRRPVRILVSDTVSITIKTKLQNEP
jgi:hypothetical protein